MAEATQTPPPQGATSAPPSDAASTPPPTPQRPEWLPEAHWDAEKGGIKEDFGKHYSELQNFHKTAAEREAALKSRKPEDVRFESTAIPADIAEEAKKHGLEVSINENDPLVPLVREAAIEEGWSQEQVNKLIAKHAKTKLAQALDGKAKEAERQKAELAKLGSNAEERIKAIDNWSNGLKQSGKITESKAFLIRAIAGDADGVELLEMFRQMATGSVPGTIVTPTPPPPPEPVEKRWYGATTPPQQKVS